MHTYTVSFNDRSIAVSLQVNVKRDTFDADRLDLIHRDAQAFEQILGLFRTVSAVTLSG